MPALRLTAQLLELATHVAEAVAQLGPAGIAVVLVVTPIDAEVLALLLLVALRTAAIFLLFR